jgi:hypothetical protein
MRTERTPWTCSWGEYRPSVRTPMWLDEWMAQWACRAEGVTPGPSGFSRCAACDRWQSRGDWRALRRPDAEPADAGERGTAG